MSELNDSSELQIYAVSNSSFIMTPGLTSDKSAVLYVLSAVTPPHEYVEDILNHFVNAIKSSTVCVLVVYVNVLAVLTRVTVVESQAECVTYPCGFLLPESAEHF